MGLKTLYLYPVGASIITKSMVHYGCFLKVGGSFMGVLMIRTLLLGVYIRPLISECRHRVAPQLKVAMVWGAVG